MTRLTVFLDFKSSLFEDSAVSLMCRAAPSDIADRIGESVLIADVGLTASVGGYLAHGRLGAVEVSGLLRIEAIEMFSREVSFSQMLPASGTVTETDDNLFQQIMEAGTVLAGSDEAVTPFAPAPEHFVAEMARLQRRRCSFSGQTTYNGDAFAIAPTTELETEETALYLFLDREAGELFSRFAWSVGPKFEILINAGATGGHFAQTVNDRGVLDVAEQPAFWPDRKALAWHREQFMARLDA